MAPIKALGRLLYFLPLFGLAALFGPATPFRLEPGLAFVFAAAYARFGALAAGARGASEALLAAETFPFLAAALALHGGLAPADLIRSAALAALLWAALLSAEDLFIPRRAGFAFALVYCAAAAACGALVPALPGAAQAAASILAIVITRYAAARRERR